MSLNNQIYHCIPYCLETGGFQVWKHFRKQPLLLVGQQIITSTDKAAKQIFEFEMHGFWLWSANFETWKKAPLPIWVCVSAQSWPWCEWKWVLSAPVVLVLPLPIFLSLSLSLPGLSESQPSLPPSDRALISHIHSIHLWNGRCQIIMKNLYRGLTEKRLP